MAVPFSKKGILKTALCKNKNKQLPEESVGVPLLRNPRSPERLLAFRDLNLEPKIGICHFPIKGCLWVEGDSKMDLFCGRGACSVDFPLQGFLSCSIPESLGRRHPVL